MSFYDERLGLGAQEKQGILQYFTCESWFCGHFLTVFSEKMHHVGILPFQGTNYRPPLDWYILIQDGRCINIW